VAGFFADITPLRTPDFRRLFAAGVVTVVGANLTIFAVPVQMRHCWRPCSCDTRSAGPNIGEPDEVSEHAPNDDKL
jgi:hypothetical protein